MSIHLKVAIVFDLASGNYVRHGRLVVFNLQRDVECFVYQTCSSQQH